MLAKFTYNNSSCGWKTAITVLLASFAAAPVAAEEEVDALWKALTSGKVDFGLRWRYEHVDDDLPAKTKNADAMTARMTLGYRTGMFHKLSAYTQIEAVGAIVDDYYDGSGTSDTEYATVVDPEGIQIDQGYVAYDHNDKFGMKLGRQYITYRKGPFHRFIGTVEWRQNWQTHDAFTLGWKPIDKLNIRYAYSWKVHRIFGDDAPQPLSEFKSNSHLVNVQYSAFPHLKLEAYTYLLDMKNADRFSSDTFGIRANGVYPLNDKWGLLYTGEYAYQEDAADNPFSYSENYILGEIGLKGKFDGFVKTLTAKFSYELLSGDGSPNGAFRTILATTHAYQGWADRFVVTPNSGIEDYIYTLVAALDWDMKFIFNYHDLNSDAGSFDYGGEVDVLLSKKFMKHYTIATKASFYDADPSRRNPATTGPGADVTKVWVWFQFKF